jgi:glycosyltransferase involved in cell wall biosynthesis
MKKVLMVVFHYPPWSGGSGVHRTLKFTKYLPEYGWQPIVLTAGRLAYNQNGAASASEIPEGLEPARAFALDTAQHLSFRGSYLRWMALPDRWISWWPSAVIVGRRLIRQHRPDIIWSTYPIATAQLIGLSLHRSSGIPWVADFRDPMTEIDPRTGQEFPEDPLVRRSNGRIERPTIKYCSKAVFTTPGALSMYERRFPEVPKSRWAVIPNGYDEEDFVAAERIVRSPCSEGPRVLVHSGVLYPQARDPTSFFAALSELRREGRISPATVKIVLRACGSEELYRPQLRSLGIDDIVFLEPSIPHHDSLVEMLNADGLLIFQAASCNWQIPAKLYECLRARRPIFAMTDREGDTAVALRSEGIHSIAALDSKTEIAHGLMEFLDSIQNGSGHVGSADGHSRRARTRELAGLLDSVRAS